MAIGSRPSSVKLVSKRFEDETSDRLCCFFVENTSVVVATGKRNPHTPPAFFALPTIAAVMQADLLTWFSVLIWPRGKDGFYLLLRK